MLTDSDRKPEPIWWTIIRLLRWDKPAGRLILMIPALWAVFLAARGKPDPLLVGVIVLGSLVTSAAGCIVNDLWDRNIDPQVQRTRNRPLASRALTLRVGIGIAGVAFLCAWGLALFLKPLSYWLCVAAVPVIICYPLAKRVFPIPQLVLSIAWGFAVLISWSAVTNSLEFATWLLWAATVLWTLGFDTAYAIADRADDRRIGVRSSALFFGRRVAEAIGLFFLGTALFLAYVGVVMKLNYGFWIALGLAFSAWGWQYRSLSQVHAPEFTYPAVFRQNVWIGFGLLAGMLVGLYIQ
ncbi:MAG: 4-hydroxybenzoate solanesyltransferase [Leptolyngbyaceae cyanobacterium bins.59]|nr:4-hydroxybenzoate solanesyltransferase [Leptolyngbyaceae cyanobacterium bins.59]